MASVVDDSSADEALSSLGDSSYEFVDDRSIVSSDDEEEQGFMSQSVSSVGLEQETQAPFQTSNEDAHRNEATGSDTRENSDVQHQSRPPSSMSVKSHDKENEDATPWTSTAILDSKQPIALTPSSAGSSEASYTLATFEKPHLPEAVPRNAVDIVRAELKLSMLSDTLILKRPFRLLYVGSPVGKEAIVQKLASTLAMSVKNEDTASSIKQPSKINIFPISEFGAGESPEVVMIDSMGVEMNIEECRSASFIKGHEGSDRLSMTLYDGKVVEDSVFGEKWKLPDLAVFYQADDDDTKAIATRHFARILMARLHVPSIIITETSLLYKPFQVVTLDLSTPHLSLQSKGPEPSSGRVFGRLPVDVETLCRTGSDHLEDKGPEPSSGRVFGRLPVDVETFCRIDSGKLNRNLAFQAHVRKSTRVLSDESSTEDLRDGKELGYFECIRDGWSKYIVRRSRMTLTELVAILLLMVIFVFPLPELGHFFQVPANKGNTSVDTATGFQIPTPSPVLMNPDQVGKTPSKPASSLSKETQDSVSTSIANAITDLTNILVEPHGVTPNDSDKFQVRLDANNQVILRPPVWLARFKKAPKLQIIFSRNGREIHRGDISLKADTDYGFKVPAEEAYGVVNVSVRSMTRPKLRENIQVDFGTSWLSDQTWRPLMHGVCETFGNGYNLVQNWIGLGLSDNHTGLLASSSNGRLTNSDKWRTAYEVRQAFLQKTSKARETWSPQTMHLHRDLSKSIAREYRIFSTQAKIHALQLRREAHRQSHEIRSMVMQQSQALTRAVHQLENNRKANLRQSQKQVLKAWWRLVGAPQPDAPKREVEKRKTWGSRIMGRGATKRKM